jgi:hypothetical protein
MKYVVYCSHLGIPDSLPVIMGACGGSCRPLRPAPASPRLSKTVAWRPFLTGIMTQRVPTISLRSHSRRLSSLKAKNETKTVSLRSYISGGSSSRQIVK